MKKARQNFKTGLWALGEQPTIAENRALKEENKRLRLAIAILRWKPGKRKGGRPRGPSPEYYARLAAGVDRLKAHYGYATRTAVIRRVAGDMYVKDKCPRRLVDSKQAKAEMKTLLNRIGEASPKKKSRKP